MNLLVLRCQDIEQTKRFYEQLGLVFIKEKHGKGPAHYSTSLNSLILELYPASKRNPVDHCRLGFDVSSALLNKLLNKCHVLQSIERKGTTICVIRDPDQRTVELKRNDSTSCD